MADAQPPKLRAENERLAAENREIRLRLEEADRAVRDVRMLLAESLASKAVTAVEAAEHKRTREALRESDARHRLLAETMLQGVVHQTADGTIVSMNAAAERMLGKSPAEFLGSSSVRQEHQTIHEDGSPFPGADHPSMLALRTGQPVRDVAMGVFNPRDQAYRWINVDAVPLFRPGEDRPYEVYTVFADISERKRAEEALRASEKKYRDLFSSMTEGFAVHEIICDAQSQPTDYRFLELNPAFERLTGLGREVIGKTHNEVLPDDDPKWVQLYGKVALTGEPIRFENYSPALGRHYEVAAFRPTPGHFATVFADITGRKRVEQALRDSERLYRAIGETIDYGVWVCTPDGRNVYASDSFLKLVGLTQEQCSNFGWGGVLHADDAERTMAAWQKCIASQGTWDIEHRFRGVDGQWHPILARGVPVRNERGEITCWAGINLDISRLKRTEDALREADRRKNEFLAVLSHELRNPLTAIANSVTVLEQAPPDGEQARRAREIISRQVAQLSSLVNDLLDVTRISRNKIQLQQERLDLCELVRRTVEDNHGLFEQTAIALESSLPPAPVTIVADRTRVAQVLSNLLQNAAKFTGRGGRTRVVVSGDASSAILRVTDSGMGMSQHTLARLFEPFMQAEQSLDRSKGGLGLGLALVRGLVELHGGSVSAHSDGLGHGTEFVVRLPRGRRDDSFVPRQTSPPPECHRRVLIIEDNVDAASSLSEVLELAHHDVQVAYNGPDGVARARALRPDVVLCDIGLPGMDGYEVARTIRADPNLRDVYVVALSGYALPEDLERAAAAGFHRHLAKPPSIDKLKQLLAEIPGRRPGARA